MKNTDYSGYWTGKFEGTNYGGATLDIHQDGNKISGIAKLHELALGQYEYLIEGITGVVWVLRTGNRAS